MRQSCGAASVFRFVYISLRSRTVTSLFGIQSQACRERKMRIAGLICVSVFLIGCGQENLPSSAPDGEPAADSSDTGNENQTDADRVSTAFGIADDFSGKLSEEQEAAVPEAFRGAFYIESLSHMTAGQLDKELEFKTLIAEAERDGSRLVALKDLRHVQFSDEVSGQMIVIERYLLTSE